MKKTIVLVSLLALPLVIASPVRASAAECDFKDQLSAFTNIKKNSSLEALDILKQELAARRALLSATLACDEKGMADRREALEKLPATTKTLPAYKQTIEGFEGASKYYEKQKSNIPNLGIQGTKDVSRVLASWREEVYLPLMMRADDLLLWTKNQEFIDKVSARLTQISRVAFSLKLVDQDQITEGFQKAQSQFQTATTENDKAREALNEGRTEEAHTHIKASLKALSDIYQLFFDLQSELQKIIK